jgi:hypothetical protein
MLNISRQIYSGWNTTGTKEDLPEAEVIPFGLSTNEKKKLESITKRYNVLAEHENIPLPGFTLYKTNRKNWGSADQTWLVIDPRGFLVRISNDNLEEILYVTGITEGLIQEKCVWAREDTQTKMVLVPISSPKYIEAIKNTELIESRVDIRDVQIGDTVLLQNKLTGIYRGVLSLYAPIDGYESVQKPQTFLRRQIVEVSPKKYYYQTDLKILRVEKKSKKVITREESAALLNDEIERGVAYFSNTAHMSASGYYSVRGMIRHVSVHAVPKVTMSLEEITKDEAEYLLHYAISIGDSGVLALECNNKLKHLIDFTYAFMSNKLKATVDRFESYKIMDIDTGAEGFSLLEDTNRGWPNNKNKEIRSLDSFVKFYRIIKHVKNGSYI